MWQTLIMYSSKSREFELIHRESELLGVKHSQKLLQKVTEIKPQRETQNTISLTRAIVHHPD